MTGMESGVTGERDRHNRWTRGTTVGTGDVGEEM